MNEFYISCALPRCPEPLQRWSIYVHSVVVLFRMHDSCLYFIPSLTADQLLAFRLLNCYFIFF